MPTTHASTPIRPADSGVAATTGVGLLPATATATATPTPTPASVLPQRRLFKPRQSAWNSPLPNPALTRALPLGRAAAPSKTARPTTAANNSVTVDGVTLPRFQPQRSLATQYSAQDLDRIGINASNTRIYVVDDFVNKTMSFGNGPTARRASHGDIVVGVLNSALKGRGEITPLNAMKPGGQLFDNDDLNRAVEQVLSTEMKRQKVPRDKLDLTHVTLNLSLETRTENTGLTALLKEFTARGGHVFAGAGNEQSTDAIRLPNINVVDGSNQVIGEKIVAAPLPWSSYKNGGVDVNGRDTRANRPTHPASQSIIAPSKLTTRSVNGTIEFRDPGSPTGWSKLVDASRTVPTGIKVETAAGLEGQKPGRAITGQQAKDFQAWRAETARAALAASSNKTAEIIEHTTPREQAAFDAKVTTEFRRRFGDRPVMNLAEYQKFSGKGIDSREQGQVNASIPNGMPKTSVAFSVAQLLNELATPEKFDIQYFSVRADGKLQSFVPDTNQTNGTSWATPYAAAQHAIWQQAQINAAKAR